MKTYEDRLAETETEEPKSLEDYKVWAVKELLDAYLCLRLAARYLRAVKKLTDGKEEPIAGAELRALAVQLDHMTNTAGYSLLPARVMDLIRAYYDWTRSIN
jgi:hypothetical protein